MKEFTRLHSPSLSWASVPLLPGTLALLSGGGFHNSSEVTLVAPDGTKHITPALDASTAALKFKMPDEPGLPPHLFSTSSALLLHSFCTALPLHSFCTPSALPLPLCTLSAGAFDVRVDGSAPLPVNVPDMCAPAS